MKLLIYDKFFDSFIKLPRNIQKKVSDFQKKFRENSKSSAIHLEPISTFKDKTFRSARVDQTYRAIIKAPENGDVYYLLWVDHHDKAYEWAENKVFQWNEATQSGQIFTAPDVIEDIQKEDKVEIKATTFFSDFTKEQLLKVGVPEILLPSIVKINNFDDLEKIEDYIPEEVFENLYFLLDGANIETLIFDIEEGKANTSEQEEQLKSINNQRSFIEFTDSNFEEIFNKGLDKWKYFLHPSQRKLVSKEFKGSVKVSGGAGTGKTVAALHRLKYLSDTNQQGQKILFTTYTKALAQNLDKLATGLGVNKSKVNIINIDAEVSRLIRLYDILKDGYKVFEWNTGKTSQDIWEQLMSDKLSSYAPDFLDQEYKDVIIYNNIKDRKSYFRISRIGRGKPLSRRQRDEIWSLFEEFNSYRKPKNIYYQHELYNLLYDYLTQNNIYVYENCIVDELQDFSNVELRLIRCLTQEKSNDLFLVGDPLQKVYDRKLNFSKIGISIRGKRSQRLRINYRTTEEIKKLAISVINSCHFDNFDGEEESKKGYVSLFHGQKPTYTIFKTKDEETGYILEQIKDLLARGVAGNEIAISARYNNSLKDFRNMLHQNDISYADAKNTVSNGINILSFHKMKGLEFKHVFLVDVNHRTLSERPNNHHTLDENTIEEYQKREKSLFYVAISRAIEHVTITGIGTKSTIVSL